MAFFGEFLGMTTASTRAVSISSVSRLRIALLAATSASLIASVVPASAATCTTSVGNDTCVITLGDVGVTVNGQVGTDKLQFDSTVTTLDATQFGTAAPANFLNFEAAQVLTGATITMTDASSTDSAAALDWTVDAGGSLTLAGIGGDRIGNSSSVIVNGALNILGSGETINALAGTGTVSIGSGLILTTGFSDSVFSGVISGAGAITKNGTGKWTLSGDNSFSGPIVVNAGTLEVNNAGAIDQASGVTIVSGQLTSVGVANYNINGPVTITGGRLTGNATINGNVSSNGGLQAGNTSVPPGGSAENPGQDMGTIRINGTYTATGVNAYFGSFINLDAAAPAGGTPGVTHDFLDINGSITGTQKTMYALASFLPSPTGFATTGNGIQAIRITGTNSGNDFYQGSALNAGGYQYLLKYVPNYNIAGDDGYFLQSAVRDELIVRPAVISAGQTLVRDCYHDNQRVPDSPKGATYGRGWIGYGRGSSTFGSDTGVHSDVNFSCTTGGMDWRMGGGWFGGVSGGFGDTDGSVTTPAGVGKFTGSGRAAEVFASFTSRALFINLSAGYNAMDYTYNGALTSGLIGKTAGLIATAQTGVALDLDAIAVKLLGQLSYDGTNCSDTCFGVRAQQDSGLVEAKGSVRFDGVASEGAIRPWVALSFSDVLSNGINTATINTVSVSQDANSQIVSLDGGMQAYLDQNFALTLEGGYHESLTVDVSGYKAAVGLKMYW